MGARQGHWHIECGASVIDGEFKYNFPDNENFIGFRIFRREPTEPYIYEGKDMKGRQVRLTIESRLIFCQSSPFWKATYFIWAAQRMLTNRNVQLTFASSSFLAPN